MVSSARTGKVVGLAIVRFISCHENFFFKQEALGPLFFSTATIIALFFGVDLINDQNLEVFLTNFLYASRPSLIYKMKKTIDSPIDSVVLDHAMKAVSNNTSSSTI